MAESETECDTPGLDTLGSECVITHTQVGDLHYAAETEIMTQEDKRLDLEAIHGDLGAVACVDAVTETDHDYIKSEVHHDPQYFGGADMKGNEALLGEVLLKAEMGGAGAEHVVKDESDHGGELTVESENGVIIHEAQGLQCNECGEIFGSMTDLHQHFEMHKATHPYICIQCGESFAVEASLRGHMKIHMKEKGYSTTGVEMVGKGVIDAFNLKPHQMMHSPEKPHRHQRVHLDEKTSYSAIPTGKGFPPTTILKQRILQSEKPYRCSQCGKGFNHSSSLSRHHRIHIDQ
ncbi:zinc finger protein 883 [Tachysurus ichikawai]